MRPLPWKSILWMEIEGCYANNVSYLHSTVTIKATPHFGSICLSWNFNCLRHKPEKRCRGMIDKARISGKAMV